MSVVWFTQTDWSLHEAERACPGALTQGTSREHRFLITARLVRHRTVNNARERERNISSTISTANACTIRPNDWSRGIGIMESRNSTTLSRRVHSILPIRYNGHAPSGDCTLLLVTASVKVAQDEKDPGGGGTTPRRLLRCSTMYLERIL